MFPTLQSFREQLASLFGGGGNSAPPQFGGAISPTGSTYPTPENTNLATYNPAGTQQQAPSGFGLNAGTLGLGLGGLQALGSFIQGRKATELAQDQFDFTKSLTNTNLNNSIKSYNTALEDRLRARGVTEGTDPAVVQANINRNRLSR